jgi:hypothetical protein
MARHERAPAAHHHQEPLPHDLRPAAMNTPRSTLLIMLVAVSLMIAACGSATPTSATGSPSPSPAGGPVTTPEQAVARVLQIEPRLVGITQRDPNAIGQAAWYEVTPASGVGAFIVSVRVGWGDCPAGCISEHTWVYAVGPGGEVTVQSEGGEPVPGAMWPSPAAGSGGGGGGVDGPGTGLFITAVAGPTCPVEQDPPDPACAPRPVATALIVVTDAQGQAVAKVQLDETGTAFIELPPGNYLVEASPVEGLMGTATSQNATVVDGVRTPVDLVYDTGIR